MLPPARWANPIALALYVVHWFLLAPLRLVPQETSILKGERGYASSIESRWDRRGELRDALETPRSGIAGPRFVRYHPHTVLELTPGAALHRTPVHPGRR